MLAAVRVNGAVLASQFTTTCGTCVVEELKRVVGFGILNETEKEGEGDDDDGIKAKAIAGGGGYGLGFWGGLRSG